MAHDAGLTSFKRLCRELGIQTWPYKAGKPLDPSFVDQMLASRHTERDLDRRMHLGNQTMSKNTNTMDGNNAACDGGTSVLTLPHQRPISASKVADLQAIRRLELPSTIDEKIEMLRQINEVLELSRGYVCMQLTPAPPCVVANNAASGYTPFVPYVMA